MQVATTFYCPPKVTVFSSSRATSPPHSNKSNNATYSLWVRVCVCECRCVCMYMNAQFKRYNPVVKKILKGRYIFVLSLICSLWLPNEDAKFRNYHLQPFTLRSLCRWYKCMLSEICKAVVNPKALAKSFLYTNSVWFSILSHSAANWVFPFP